MRHVVHVLVSLVMPVLATGALGAQQAPSSAGPVVDAALVRGAPVRVDVAGGSRLAGTLVRLDADSLQVSNGARLTTVPRAQVTSIYVKDGGRSHGAGAVRGAVIGIVTGAVIGGISGYATWEPCPEGSFICLTGSRGSEAALSATAGGLVGGAVGALVGASVGRQRWRRAPFSAETRVGVIATPSRVGLTLRI